MTDYQNNKAIAFVAIPTLCVNGLLAVYAAVNGQTDMLFTAICGMLAAFTAVCMVDSLLAEERRAYVRRVRR